MKHMNKLFTKSMMTIAMIIVMGTFSNAALISDAGVASAVEDSICVDGTTTLLLTGYTGTIQWQRYDGANWIDEVLPGATTDSYNITLTVTTDFRAVVTDAGFPPDTSNVITITVGVTPPLTTGDSRCGYGPVTLTASGGGSSYKWYDVQTGGSPLYVGSSFTTNVSNTTTFYAAAATNGGGTETMPQPTQTTTFSSNARGYYFTAPSNFTITGLYVPEPANGSTQNIAIIKFNPAVPPPAYPTVTNAFTTLYLTQNDPSTGVITVNIPVFAGDVIGVLATRGANDVNSYGVSPFSTTIDGQTVTISRMGMQFPLSTQLPHDIWEEPAGGNISRLEITYEVGCESSRTPAIATVNPAPAITLNATPPALCQGQSSVLTVSSSNPNYSYTWSPATGLSGTTGTTVTASPLTPVTYTVIAVDGLCGEIDSVFMSVGPASVAGTATISSDTICAGTNAYLQLTGNTGNIQWQSFDGTNWVNETGPGSTSANYAVSPSGFTIYQAVITSGGCDPDTTISLNLEVISIVDPVTVNDTICDPGMVNLSATGPGLLNWYTSPTGGASINTGTSYSPMLTTTTTYYVQASAGGIYQAGAVNAGIGSQTPIAGNDFGLQFDVTQQATIEKVYISPAATGTVTINLRDTQGGPILNTVTAPVTGFSGLVPVSLGFTVNPGTYRLEMAAGSANCYYNTNGALYPYTSAGSPVTITGYLNPGFNVGGVYYFFYNWEVNQGCASSRIPVTGFVNAPAIPVISQNGTQLTSSAPANNQWNLNGNPIPGATGTTYDMSLTGPGTYTVTVSENGCSSTSQPVLFTSIENEFAMSGILVYPNPVKDFISVELVSAATTKITIHIFNILGEKVLSRDISDTKTEVAFTYPAGVYTIEIINGDKTYVTKVIKQ